MAIVLLVPLLLGYLLLVQSRRADESYAWVQHTHDVLTKLEVIRDLVRDAESTQRAFLLTRSGHFDTEFRVFADSLPAAVQGFRRLIKDNPEQTTRFKVADKILEERMAILKANAENFRSMDPETLVRRLELGAQKSAELEEKIQDVALVERVLLEQRRMKYLADSSSFRDVAAWTVGGGFVLLAGIGMLLYQESRSRTVYESRLSDARDAALDAVKTTSAFVASVSHEIRTPMNGVLGTADLMLRDRTLSARQKDGLETIRSSGRSLLAIINDILDLSKLQAGEMQFVNEPFSPAEVVEEVIALFAAQAAKKGIELTPHMSPDVPLRLDGDRLRLRQVLANLLSNAVKFTEKGGVAIHVVRRREVESDGRVCLRFDISDTGPGIAREVQDRLFQPFAQVDLKLSQRHGGTGLGLAVSRELVQRMNGVMGVESTPGQGATFWFTTLFGKGEDVSGTGTLEARPLLVLEPRPMTADSLRAHAVAWGLIPYVYTDAGELPTQAPWSEEKSARPLPQAVVVGSAMAQDWLEAVKKLRSREWLAHVPIFLMTDQEELTHQQMARDGITATLNYPFRPSELYDRLAGVHEPATVEATLASKLDLPPARVIVADDNPVNRRVIGNQLDYLGMEVVQCSDGLEAVARVQEEAGVLVLMDCQMPDMDGFEATRTIRAWERKAGRKPIPIIAVTAHVMSGDAEQCLQSGMNAYLAKPVELDKLQQMLAQWLPHAAPLAETPDGSPSPASEDAVPVVNESQLKACLTGEPELDEDLIQMAVKQAEEMLEKMQASLEAGNDAGWRQAAHRARGSCGTMGFSRLAALLQTAEFDATSQEARTRILGELKGAMEQLVARLAALKA